METGMENPDPVFRVPSTLPPHNHLRHRPPLPLPLSLHELQGAALPRIHHFPPPLPPPPRPPRLDSAQPLRPRRPTRRPPPAAGARCHPPRRKLPMGRRLVIAAPAVHDFSPVLLSFQVV
ncbi:hypothetical protein H6P81_018889 [Aristolochia fimbriata]|uniref:Uncharacterized protein n=1 Tax=Aristolochia fimbriata TaxID=158543 RepID=A0AAV7E4I2_ARIFI|nr:hypothetical protein H6P81_018889 [Aristolochia fimbriata]